MKVVAVPVTMSLMLPLLLLLALFPSSLALLLPLPPRPSRTVPTGRGPLVVGPMPPPPIRSSFIPGHYGGTRLCAVGGGEDERSSSIPRHVVPRTGGFSSLLSNLLRRSGLSALFASSKGGGDHPNVDPKKLIDSDQVEGAMPTKEPYWAMQEEDEKQERNSKQREKLNSKKTPPTKSEKKPLPSPEPKSEPPSAGMMERRGGGERSHHRDEQQPMGIKLDVDIDPEVAERVKSAVREYLTEPLLSPDIERDVPTDVIRGAVVNGLAVALLATEFGSIPAAVVSAAVSGYLAITPGPVGDLVRRLGGFSARIGQSFSDLFLGGKPSEHRRRPQRSTPMGGGIDFDTELERVLREAAEAERQAEAAARELARVEEESSRMEELVEEEQVAAAERAKREHIAKLEAAEGELIRLAEEKHRERVRLEEEEAERVERRRMEEEEERIAEEMKAKAEREAQERAAAEEAELDRQRREAAKKAEQERLSQLEAKKREQKRIAAEKLEKERKEKERAAAAAKAEQDRIAKLKAEEEERKRVAAEQARLEKERLEEEKRKADEEERKRVAAEQARLEQERIEEEKAERERVVEERRMEEEKLKEEEAQRQEWEEAVRLAQRLDGVDEATADADVSDMGMAMDNEKTQWDAAHRLAKSLATGDKVSEVNAKAAVRDSAPEAIANSQEELGRLAREAVEKFEAERMAQEEVDRKVKFGKSLKRRSSRVPETNSVAVQNSGDVDWESMTVAELKVALRDRGLKVSGRKAELIERLKRTQA